MCPNRYTILLSAFISGASIMIAEMAGLRALAPYFGGSISVLSAVISIILLGLAVGAYVGGQLIDRSPSSGLIQKALLWGAILTALIPLLGSHLNNFLASSIEHVELGAILGASLLYLGPSIVLGSICPMCTCLLASGSSKVGQSAGMVALCATTGSIIGTLFAGLYLLPEFGIRATLYLATSVLILTATTFSVNPALLLALILIACSYFISPKNKGIVELESAYSHITVKDTFDSTGFRPIRTLRTDPFTLQGAVYLDLSAEAFLKSSRAPMLNIEKQLYSTEKNLPVPYTRYFRIGAELCPAQCSALMIGGGTYSYPKDFIRSNSNGKIKVVEIDPKITQLARDFFYLRDEPSLSLANLDGRVYLNRSKSRYDLIILDAYSAQSIPAHLLSLEAFGSAKDRLNPDGVIVINILSALEGKSSGLFNSVYATLLTLFPKIVVYAVKSRHIKNKVQNIIIIAGQEAVLNRIPSLSESSKIYLDNLWLGTPKRSAPVFSDDSLLAEHYGMFIARELRRDFLG